MAGRPYSEPAVVDLESQEWQESWGDVPQPSMKVQDWGDLPQPSSGSHNVGEPAVAKSQDWQDWGDVPQPGDLPQHSIESRDVAMFKSQDWQESWGAMKDLPQSPDVGEPAVVKSQEWQDWGDAQPWIESQGVGEPAAAKDWEDWGDVPQPADLPQSWVESQDGGEPGVVKSEDWQDCGDVPQPAMEDDVPETAPDTKETNSDAASLATTLSLGSPWEEETEGSQNAEGAQGRTILQSTGTAASLSDLDRPRPLDGQQRLGVES